MLKKVLLDQFILSPPILVIFFVSFGLMEGKSNILEECQNKFLTTFQVYNIVPYIFYINSEKKRVIRDHVSCYCAG